jgi:hypothetical protein
MNEEFNDAKKKTKERKKEYLLKRFQWQSHLLMFAVYSLFIFIFP